MSTRAATHPATVLSCRPLSEHLWRLELGGEGLAGFTSTGVPDEWVGLVVPGQFQSRYYTVRHWDGVRLTLDVMVHDVGLVTEWVARGCVGDEVVVTEPKGAFAAPDEASWLLLVGDLTALPAMARIAAWQGTQPVQRAVHVHVELPTAEPGDLVDELPADATVTWHVAPAPGQSALADVVTSLVWPEGDGYFWMGGESAQMRAVRRHLMRERELPGSAYHVMGYWRSVLRRQPRAVDPGPIWRAGKAQGKTDEEIWADYDAAREP